MDFTAGYGVRTGSGAQSCREPRHASSKSPSASRDRVGHVCEGTTGPLLLKTDSPGPHLQHISCMAWRSKVPMLSLCPGSLFPCCGRSCPMMGSGPQICTSSIARRRRPGSADVPGLLRQSRGIVQYFYPGLSPRFFAAPHVVSFLHRHPEHGYRRYPSPIKAEASNMNTYPATCVTANRLDGRSPAADDMKIDCEPRSDSSNLQRGPVDDTAVAAAQNEKVSAVFTPTSNATAPDDSDMMRQEKLGHIKPLDDVALEATRAYLQQRFARRSLPRRDGLHHIVYGGVSNRRRSTDKYRPAASRQADERQIAPMVQMMRDLEVVEPGSRSIPTLGRFGCRRRRASI